MSDKKKCEWIDGVCARWRFLIKYGMVPVDGYYGCCGDKESVIHPKLNIAMPKNPYAKKCSRLAVAGCKIKPIECENWFCDFIITKVEEPKCKRHIGSKP